MGQLAKQELNMNELVQIQEEFSGLATITPEKMQKITERMVEIERANNSLGRRNTQTTNQADQPAIAKTPTGRRM